MPRQPRLSLDALAPCLLDFPDPPAPLVWSQVFGNDRPVQMEVGFGKGLFLLTACQALPAVNFLGIEIARKYQLSTATRLAKRGLTNARLICGDGKLFLARCVPAGSLQTIHVFFPDPWWKKRHLKRRLFTPEFAAACAIALQPGGQLYVVTDVEEYFQHINELVSRTPLKPLPAPDPQQPAHDLDYLTNFERKFRKEGRPIYRAMYEA